MNVELHRGQAEPADLAHVLHASKPNRRPYRRSRFTTQYVHAWANPSHNNDAYGWGGFYDAINVRTGQVSKYYLSLDQGMIMAAIGNAVRGDRLQTYFTKGMVQNAVRPILQMEQFTAGGDIWIH